MRFPSAMSCGVLTAAVLSGALCLLGQAPVPPVPDALTNKAKGIPPRVSPAEYQAHAEAGTVTVAAEFVGHSVPTPDGTFTSEDYVVLEVGLFGPPDARTKLSASDFSLRINGNKKTTNLPSQPFDVVAHSLKDPEWSPPPVDKDDSKSPISTGGKAGGANDGKPPPPKMPIPLVLAMDQKVQKARLPEGERALPQAGLLFFQYRGKETSIHTMELIYSGAAGKATVTLQ